MAGEEKLRDLPPKVLEAIRLTEEDEKDRTAKLAEFRKLARRSGDGVDTLIVAATSASEQ